MNMCCSSRRIDKKVFMFENGTSVRARSFEDAIKTLKSAREITRVDKISNSWDVEYGPDVCVFVEQDCSSLLARERSGWNLYLDKREPILVHRGVC